MNPRYLYILAILFFGCGGTEPPPAKGACTNAADLAVYETLTLTTPEGEELTAAAAAGRIGEDCVFGPPPQCGAEVGEVITDNSVENNNALAACVVDCMQLQIDLSDDCSSCYTIAVTCAASNCVPECAGGASEPECIQCRDDHECDSPLGDCTGAIGDNLAL